MPQFGARAGRAELRSRWPGENKIPATTAAPVRRDRAPQGAREGGPLVKSTLSHFYQGHLQPLVKSRTMKQYSPVGAEDTEGARGHAVSPLRERWCLGRRKWEARLRIGARDGETKPGWNHDSV